MRYGKLMGRQRKSILIKKVKSFDPFSGASENHKLLNISAAYILAESEPELDWKNYSNQEVYQRAKNFLSHEAKDAFKKGLWEFDSSNYIMFHINSWILLHDFAIDTEIKRLSKFVLDSIFAGIAPEIIDGTWAASTSRTYTPINANYRDKKGNIAFTWLAFGHRRKSMGEPRIITLAVSDYRIPQEIVAAAITRDDSILPYEHKEKHSRFRSGKYPFYKYSWIDRGYGIYSTYDGNEVTKFKTDQYHKWGIAWNGGYFVLKDIDLQSKYPTGDSPYNQVLQHQNVILGVTIQPEKIQRYQKNISDNILAGGWEFMTGGDSLYIAFYQVDNYRGWIVETYPKNSFATLEEFAAYIIKKSEINLDKIDDPLPALSYKTSKGDRLSITYQNDHSYINKKQKVNGKSRNYQSWPVIKNPWMRFNEEKQELILIANKVEKHYTIKDLEIRCIHN